MTKKVPSPPDYSPSAFIGERQPKSPAPDAPVISVATIKIKISRQSWRILQKRQSGPQFTFVLPCRQQFEDWENHINQPKITLLLGGADVHWRKGCACNSEKRLKIAHSVSRQFKEKVDHRIYGLANNSKKYGYSVLNYICQNCKVYDRLERIAHLKSLRSETHH